MSASDRGDIDAEHMCQSKATTIGRDVSNMVQLTEGDVSKKHAVIAQKLLSWVIHDLDSSNGVFVNGKRIKKKARLKNGDEVSFGPVSFVFELASSMSGWGRGLIVDASPRSSELTIVRTKDGAR